MTQPLADAPSRAAYSARMHLAVYGLAIALPLIVALAFFLSSSIAQQRQQSESRILQVLNDLLDNLDRDLDRHLTILNTLATSSFLSDGDWKAFHGQAQAALQGRSYLVLIDMTGRQILNTYVPLGQEPQTTGDMETVRRIAATGRPVFSNLFTSKVVHQPVLNVSIPIMRGESPAYVLSLGLLPQDLAKILAGLHLDENWVTTVWDAHGTVIARSRDMERFLGTSLPPKLRPDHTEKAVFRTDSLNSEWVLRAVGTSPLSGWGVAVNLSVDFVDREVRAAVWWLAAIALTSLLATLLLAYLLAGVLSRPLARIADAALALGRQEPPVGVRSWIAEVSAVSEALQRAHQAIVARGAALAESERRLAAVLQILPLGIALVDPSGRTVIANAAYRRYAPERIPSADDERWHLWQRHDRDGRQVERRNYPAARALRGELVWPGEEFRYTGDEKRGPFWTRMGAIPFHDAQGMIVGATIIIDDIEAEWRANEERKRADEQKGLLINELNHRVKNTLAVVQAIAHLTIRRMPATADAAETFQGRLLALSAAHDILTKGNWESAGLREVIERAVAPHRGEGVQPFEVGGPDVRLSPKAALALTMGLHELCTNAAKYGALSVPGGRVKIAWTIERGSPRRVRLRWQEYDGPRVQKPPATGFGTQLIATAMAQDLGGTVELLYPEDGVVCLVEFPNSGVDG